MELCVYTWSNSGQLFVGWTQRSFPPTWINSRINLHSGPFGVLWAGTQKSCTQSMFCFSQHHQAEFMQTAAVSCMTVHKQQTAQGFSCCKNTKQLGTLCTFENQRLYRHSRLKKITKQQTTWCGPTYIVATAMTQIMMFQVKKKTKQTKETIKKQEIS